MGGNKHLNLSVHEPEYSKPTANLDLPQMMIVKPFEATIHP